jgi:tRNA(Arg) A34 adenosine deaminase TadA
MSGSVDVVRAGLDERFMRLAVEEARRGVMRGHSPFGCAIAKDGELVAVAHNIVWGSLDPTAHAEVNCIRKAAAELKTISLAGCTLYTTCEPCPMCLAATHWAGVDRCVYGATIADAAGAGFRELEISAADMVRLGGSKLLVEMGPLRDECKDLFALFKRLGLAGTY